MLKYSTLLVILFSMLLGIDLYSSDITPTGPNPKTGKLGKISPNKVYIRFRQGAVGSLNLQGNMHTFSNTDAKNILSNPNVIKLTPLLNPLNSVTYNKEIQRKSNTDNTMAVQKLMNAEEPLLRTFKLEYDGLADPETYCKLLLKTEKSLEIAEPCYLNEVQALPNDPMMESQSYLKQIKAYSAWSKNLPGSEGSPSMIIAVSDNGIEQEHVDIENSISVNTGEIPGNSKDDDGNGYIDDYKGYNFNNAANGNYDYTFYKDSHGTNVTGIVSATANNNTGITGVSYKCKLFPIRAGNDGGDVEWGYESLIYAAIRGFKVINCSWGYQYKDFSQIEQSIIDFAVQKDLAIVVASGNAKKSQTERFYPSLYQGVLSVGEVDASDAATGNNCWNEGIDIMAPGKGNYSLTNYNGYDFLDSGTSFASPVVAGVVGIVRAKHPGLTALQALEFTRQCTDDISKLQDNSNWEKFIPGRVNFEKAVTVEPFSIPSVRPLKIKYKNSNGAEVQRFFLNDTITIDIDAFNYLGPANNLGFRLSVIKDNLQQVDLINDYISISSIQGNSSVAINGFSFVTTKNSKARVYFRVEITGENGYKDFFLMTAVPNNDVHDFANQRFKFSLCDKGNFGFSPEDRGFRNGLGLVYKNYENQIFEGGIAASVNDNKIISSVNPTQSSDFDVVKPYLEPDKFTNIVNDEISKIVNLDITQKLLFNESGNEPCFKIEVTAKNNSTSDIMNPSIGYYFDWDIADKYEENKIRLFPEAIPNQLKDKAAAHIMQYPYDNSHPVFSVMVFSNEANCQPQAASFQSSSTDETKQLTWLNSGTSIEYNPDAVFDIADMIGMKFPGTLLPGESRTFYLMICGEENVNKLIEAMNVYSLDVEETVTKENGILLSPVPADDKLNINLSKREILDGLVIYNLLGSKVYEINNIQSENEVYYIDVSNLSPGIYYLHAIINGNQVNAAFIIAR